MHCTRMGVYDDTPNPYVPVIPDDTFTLSSSSFSIICLTQKMHHECCQEVPMNYGSLGITRLRVLMIRLNAYNLTFRDSVRRRAVISGKGTRRGGPLVFVGSLWVMACMLPNHDPLADNRYHSICHSGTDFTTYVSTHFCHDIRICSGRTLWKSQTNYTVSYVSRSAYLKLCRTRACNHDIYISAGPFSSPLEFH